MPRTGRPKEFAPNYVTDIALEIVKRSLRQNPQLLQTRVDGHHARGDARPFEQYLRESVAIFEERSVRAVLRAKREIVSGARRPDEDGVLVAMYVENMQSEGDRKKLRAKPSEEILPTASRMRSTLMARFALVQECLDIVNHHQAKPLDLPTPQIAIKKTGLKAPRVSAVLPEELFTNDEEL